MIQFVSSNGMYILYKYYTHNYHYTYLPYYTITHTIPLSILYCYLYYTTIHMILLTMPYHYPYYTTIHTIQLYILYYWPYHTTIHTIPLSILYYWLHNIHKDIVLVVVLLHIVVLVTTSIRTFRMSSNFIFLGTPNKVYTQSTNTINMLEETIDYFHTCNNKYQNNWMTLS